VDRSSRLTPQLATSTSIDRSAARPDPINLSVEDSGRLRPPLSVDRDLRSVPRRNNTPPTHPEERELAYRLTRPSPAVPPSSLALYVIRVRLFLFDVHIEYFILERSRGEESCSESAFLIGPLSRLLRDLRRAASPFYRDVRADKKEFCCTAASSTLRVSRRQVVTVTQRNRTLSIRPHAHMVPSLAPHAGGIHAAIAAGSRRPPGEYTWHASCSMAAPRSRPSGAPTRTSPADP
jgi:hypothetical protein